MLTTEERNPKTLEIDRLNTLELLTLINEEDAGVASVVRNTLPAVAKAVNQVEARLKSGGRLLYIGSGTSGRLGLLDAAECPPTFGVDPAILQAILAGGDRALRQAVEWLEDDPVQAKRDLQSHYLTARDAVVGISASGRTPYTVGALAYAREVGAFTIALCCNPDTELGELADVAIEAVVGPEVVTGSTRMKAGTAQKMILNMMSTAIMIQLGNVYSNLMVNVKLSNRKLIERGIRIISQAAGVSMEDAREALDHAGDVRSAIVMLELSCTADEARGLVAQSARVSEILRAPSGQGRS